MQCPPAILLAFLPSATSDIRTKANNCGAWKAEKRKQFVRWEIKGIKNTQGQSVMRGPEVPLQTLFPPLSQAFPFLPVHTAGGIAWGVIKHIQFS